jgi:hypothetical protein
MESKGLPKLLKCVNERLCELRADSLDADAEFFCECGQRDCSEPISAHAEGISAEEGSFPSCARSRKPRSPSAAGRAGRSIYDCVQGSRDNMTISRSSIRGASK